MQQELAGEDHMTHRTIENYQKSKDNLTTKNRYKKANKLMGINRIKLQTNQSIPPIMFTDPNEELNVNLNTSATQKDEDVHKVHPKKKKKSHQVALSLHEANFSLPKSIRPYYKLYNSPSILSKRTRFRNNRSIAPTPTKLKKTISKSRIKFKSVSPASKMAEMNQSQNKS